VAFPSEDLEEFVSLLASMGCQYFLAQDPSSSSKPETTEPFSDPDSVVIFLTLFFCLPFPLLRTFGEESYK
jgi:hypothetical protein